MLSLFLDQEQLKLAEPYRPVLERELRAADHLVLLWSDAAGISTEVITEVAAFREAAALDPTNGGRVAERKVFYIPLQGSYNPLEDNQALADLRRLGVYDAASADRGVSKLAEKTFARAWDRDVGRIGANIYDEMTTSKITLAVLAMTTEMLGYVDLLIEHSPDEVALLTAMLKACNLDWQGVKSRYGASAFEWLPFGDSQTTVLDVMERAREIAMREASDMRKHMFRWRPVDLRERVRANAPLPTAQVIDSLAREGPLVIVTDPVSLYHSSIAKIFDKLETYAASPSSVILVLSPIEDPSMDSVIDGLIDNAYAILRTHFRPPIQPLPRSGVLCGNVRHPAELERYLRLGLGVFARGGPGDPLITSGM
jgi:hypothetical protein